MRRCENCKHFHKVPDNIPVELGDNYRNILLMNSCDFIWGGWMAVCYDLAKGQDVCKYHKYKKKEADDGND